MLFIIASAARFSSSMASCNLAISSSCLMHRKKEFGCDNGQKSKVARQKFRDRGRQRERDKQTERVKKRGGKMREWVRERNEKMVAWWMDAAITKWITKNYKHSRVILLMSLCEKCIDLLLLHSIFTANLCKKTRNTYCEYVCSKKY